MGCIIGRTKKTPKQKGRNARKSSQNGAKNTEILPVQIISVGDDGSIILHEDKLRGAIERYQHRQLIVVSMSGPFRSGKSTLLNVWAKKTGAFEVGHTRRSVTKGVWMHVIEHKGHVVVLLDTEGWHDSSSKNEDVWLPLIMLFISSELVINIKNNIDRTYIRNISSLLWLGNIKARKAQPTGWKVPLVRTLIRDFELQLEENETEDDYLNDQIVGNTLNEKILRKYMTNRRCHTLPRPHEKPSSQGTTKNDELVKPDEKFLHNALSVMDEMVGNQYGHSTASDWCKNVVSVTKDIEMLRKNDPNGACFSMDITPKDIVDEAKRYYDEQLEKWDIITDYPENPTKPFCENKLNTCHKDALSGAKGFLLDDEPEVTEYAESCVEMVRFQVLPKLQQDYDTLSCFGINMQGFSDSCKKFTYALSGKMSLPKFYQNQLRLLLDKITTCKEWMEAQLSRDVMKFMNCIRQSKKTEHEIKRKQVSYKVEMVLKELQDLVAEKVKTNGSSCQSIYHQHTVWWLKRYCTITGLKRLVRRLDATNLVATSSKLAAAASGLAAGGLTVLSIPMPALLPVAVDVAIFSMSLGLGALGSSSIVDAVAKSDLKKIMKEDDTETVKLQEYMQTLFSVSTSLRTHNNYVNQAHGGVDESDLPFTQLMSLIGDLSRVDPLNFADVGKQSLAREALAGTALDGALGVGLSLITMIDTIEKYEKNNGKNELSQYIGSCIDQLELEMELHTRVVIPIKYHLLKEHVLRALLK